MMFEQIVGAVKAGQGLNPEQAAYLLKHSDEAYAALKARWARESRISRQTAAVRKELRALAKRATAGSQGLLNTLADRIDGRKNRKFR